MLLLADGVVAQLGERRVRNAKVGSSTLLGSTLSKLILFRNFPVETHVAFTVF